MLPKHLLINIIKKTLPFLLICLLFISCKKTVSKHSDCTDSDYDNCDTVKPYYGEVYVYTTQNEENEYVIIKFFNENYESGDIFYIDTLTEQKGLYYFEVNRRYAAAAYYKSGNDSIIAIDGGKLEAYSYTMCEFTCYDILELKLDLRLN